MDSTEEQKNAYALWAQEMLERINKPIDLELKTLTDEEDLEC